MNQSSAQNGQGAVTVLEVKSDRSVSTKNSYNAVSNALALEKMGDYVVVANGPLVPAQAGSLSVFRANADGTLTSTDTTAAGAIGSSNADIYDLDAGSQYVVSLAAYANTLKVWSINSDGDLVQRDSETLSGSTYRYVEYYDAPGATDYIYLSGANIQGGNEVNQIAAYALNTADGTLSAVAGSPFANAFYRPGAMESVPGRLFVAQPESNPAQNGDDVMYQYNINDSTGALTVRSFVPGVGNGPSAIHAIGPFLYVTNAISGNIVMYVLNTGSSGVTAIGNNPFVTVPGSNPRSMEHLVRSDDAIELFVATSNSIAAFTVNTDTGNLTPVPGSPFGNYASPGDIRD